jgi:hypothetical protein
MEAKDEKNREGDEIRNKDYIIHNTNIPLYNFYQPETAASRISSVILSTAIFIAAFFSVNPPLPE